VAFARKSRASRRDVPDSSSGAAVREPRVHETSLRRFLRGKTCDPNKRKNCNDGSRRRDLRVDPPAGREVRVADLSQPEVTRMLVARHIARSFTRKTGVALASALVGVACSGTGTGHHEEQPVAGGVSAGASGADEGGMPGGISSGTAGRSSSGAPSSGGAGAGTAGAGATSVGGAGAGFAGRSSSGGAGRDSAVGAAGAGGTAGAAGTAGSGGAGGTAGAAGTASSGGAGGAAPEQCGPAPIFFCDAAEVCRGETYLDPSTSTMTTSWSCAANPCGDAPVACACAAILCREWEASAVCAAPAHDHEDISCSVVLAGASARGHRAQ
jgi:hypothetical protein